MCLNAQKSLHKSSSVMRNGCRSLYTAEALGLEKLHSFQSYRRRAFEADKERYISRVREYVSSENYQSLINDDFINLLALADSEEHLDLIEKVIASGHLRDLESKGWGTTVVRLYLKMNQVDRAYNTMKNPDRYHNFFEQFTSYQIVLTMLFDAGRYDDVIELHELYLQKAKPPKTDGYATRKLSVLVYASYAKMGTPEALEKTLALYEKEPDSPSMKGRTIRMLSYLAYKTGKDNLALNLLVDPSSNRHILANCIKVLALFRIKRYDDILIFLRGAIANLRDRRYKLISQEVYDHIRENLNEVEEEAIRDRLSELLNEMSEAQLIEAKSLEDIVFAQIQDRLPSISRFSDQGRSQLRDDFFRQDRDTRFDSEDDERGQSRNNRYNQYNQRGNYQPRRDGFRSGLSDRSRGQRMDGYDRDDEEAAPQNLR